MAQLQERLQQEWQIAYEGSLDILGQDVWLDDVLAAELEDAYFAIESGDLALGIDSLEIAQHHLEDA
jgi:hypothetical protein